jgi:hypothetical protein
MKNRGFWTKIILAAIAVGVIIVLACSSKSSPTRPGDQANYSETPVMKILSDSLIVAFKNGNKTKILGYMNDEFKEVYSDIQNQPDSTLAALGTALEKRRLIALSPLYAEYAVTINGQEFRVDYAQCGDDNWQLVGF